MPNKALYLVSEQEGSLPFLGTVRRRYGNSLTTEVYRKPTDTGLLLHFHSHVDRKYKISQVNIMVAIDCEHHLFSYKKSFSTTELFKLVFKVALSQRNS